MIEAEERDPKQFYSWPKQSSTNCRTVRESHVQSMKMLITQMKKLNSDPEKNSGKIKNSPLLLIIELLYMLLKEKEDLFTFHPESRFADHRLTFELIVWFGNSSNDHQARRRFVEWAHNGIAVVPDFHKRILFSDEAHFWLNGYVNKQNCRIWSEANPQVYVETPLHPEKLTVWCALWAGGIIGLYFFKNDEGHNVTVNGDRYTAMITNFFIPELNNHDVQELWSQQDGATCHTARAPQSIY
ncbi:DUF4817 domain-containing protein [Trichonephila clavipes]|uniref:DUF4817 domain-containing protein n=1 Tax=Trichonephila clavipes TaxID=2585209 RepID=A0A8X6UX30_TRICX|nr:DUF4817 domain-containing protein [Trichonephila clavipes]